MRENDSGGKAQEIHISGCNLVSLVDSAFKEKNIMEYCPTKTHLLSYAFKRISISSIKRLISALSVPS